MDLLEASLFSLYQTAREFSLFLGREDINFSVQAPAGQRPGNASAFLLPRPSAIFPTGNLEDTASASLPPEEGMLSLFPFSSTEKIKEAETGFRYPPDGDGYRQMSSQMLEDMRRRSTIALDAVRTVIL